MKYYKISQVVPGKGNAWMYYETDDNLLVQRMMTHIPENNETVLYPNPKIKTLFQPERLYASTSEEFEKIWKESAN